VAIKVIHPHLLGDEQSVARFYSEARTASRLNHPNSVSVIDFGRTEDGILYLVMEHLRGRDLARVMQEEGPLPFARIIEIMTGVLAALAEAHALDVVHRDLKPENVFLERVRSGGDMVKVVDFGLAKLTGNARGSSITSPGLVCGTPDYMSPEQGRGEEVDARGDLYSMGVLLFELLTDRLPFVDDTPTKVVLKHMTDPVPDPREVAPHRGIPAVLAEICMKAMAKTPAERFQSADEMAEALRRAGGSLRAARNEEQTCTQCGAKNPPNMRFCGECGARLPGVASSPAVTASATPRLSRPEIHVSTSRSIIGRQREIDRLEALRAAAAGRLVRAHVQGEPGVGKTRLLAQLADIAVAAGDEVAHGRPHASLAPVPYEAVRMLVCALLDVTADRLAQLATKEAGIFVDALSRAGMAELVSPQGLAGTDGKPRAGAVAAALATAVRVAAGRAQSGRVVLVVDDFFACDGLSRQVVARLAHTAPDLPALLVTASHRPIGEDGTAVETLLLRGLDRDEAIDFLTGVKSHRATATFAEPVGAAGDKRYLPLYLEQLRALGLSLAKDESALPARLADAVSQRLERLEAPARRLLQDAAVLGERCALGSLSKLDDERDRKGLDQLRAEGLVLISGDELVIAHPFVRDVVEASIPAEARKRLHEKALDLEGEAGAPLEVRAEHAFRAGEPFSALVLLERMGDEAIARGDPATAVLAFRRGLDLARREALETGDLGMDRAIATFSRKLGDAMDRAGDAAGAEGVVREALDLTARDGIERARMLLVLGRVAARRERRRDAVRVLGEAVDIATRLVDHRVAGEAQLVLARVRHDEGDELGCCNALRRAAELFAEGKAPPARQAAVAVELAEKLVDIGDLDDAVKHLERAARLAVEADAPAIAALAVGILASVDEINGKSQVAASRYREAALLAAKAGDADARERWDRATQERRRSGVGAAV
jgi:serine/threonine-protein kinase